MDSQTATQQTNDQLAIPTEIRNFLDGLLQDAGMTTLDADMREEMIKELYTRLDSFLTSTIVNNLPAENIDEFIKMNEEKRSQAEIESYLKDKMPDAEDVFAKAFMEFRDLYLGNVVVARNAPAENNNQTDTNIQSTQQQVN